MWSKSKSLFMAFFVGIALLICAQIYAPTRLKPLTNRLLDYPTGIPAITYDRGIYRVTSASTHQVSSLSLKSRAFINNFLPQKIQIAELEPWQIRLAKHPNQMLYGGYAGGYVQENGHNIAYNNAAAEAIKNGTSTEAQRIAYKAQQDAEQKKAEAAKAIQEENLANVTGTNQSSTYIALYGDCIGCFGYVYPSGDIAGYTTGNTGGTPQVIKIGSTLDAYNATIQYVKGQISNMTEQEIKDAGGIDKILSDAAIFDPAVGKEIVDSIAKNKEYLASLTPKIVSSTTNSDGSHTQTTIYYDKDGNQVGDPQTTTYTISETVQLEKTDNGFIYNYTTLYRDLQGNILDANTVSVIPEVTNRVYKTAGRGSGGTVETVELSTTTYKDAYSGKIVSVVTNYYQLNGTNPEKIIVFQRTDKYDANGVFATTTTERLADLDNPNYVSPKEQAAREVVTQYETGKLGSIAADPDNTDYDTMFTFLSEECKARGGKTDAQCEADARQAVADEKVFTQTLVEQPLNFKQEYDTIYSANYDVCIGSGRDTTVCNDMAKTAADTFTAKLVANNSGGAIYVPTIEEQQLVASCIELGGTNCNSPSNSLDTLAEFTGYPELTSAFIESQKLQVYQNTVSFGAVGSRVRNINLEKYTELVSNPTTDWVGIEKALNNQNSLAQFAMGLNDFSNGRFKTGNELIMSNYTNCTGITTWSCDYSANYSLANQVSGALIQGGDAAMVITAGTALALTVIPLVPVGLTGAFTSVGIGTFATTGFGIATSAQMLGVASYNCNFGTSEQCASSVAIAGINIIGTGLGVLNNSANLVTEAAQSSKTIAGATGSLGKLVNTSKGVQYAIAGATYATEATAFVTFNAMAIETCSQPGVSALDCGSAIAMGVASTLKLGSTLYESVSGGNLGVLINEPASASTARLAANIAETPGEISSTIHAASSYLFVASACSKVLGGDITSDSTAMCGMGISGAAQTTVEIISKLDLTPQISSKEKIVTNIELKAKEAELNKVIQDLNADLKDLKPGTGDVEIKVAPVERIGKDGKPVTVNRIDTTGMTQESRAIAERINLSLEKLESATGFVVSPEQLQVLANSDTIVQLGKTMAGKTTVIARVFTDTSLAVILAEGETSAANFINEGILSPDGKTYYGDPNTRILYVDSQNGFRELIKTENSFSKDSSLKPISTEEANTLIEQANSGNGQVLIITDDANAAWTKQQENPNGALMTDILTGKKGNTVVIVDEGANIYQTYSISGDTLKLGVVTDPKLLGGQTSGSEAILRYESTKADTTTQNTLIRDRLAELEAGHEQSLTVMEKVGDNEAVPKDQKTHAKILDETIDEALKNTGAQDTPQGQELTRIKAQLESTNPATQAEGIKALDSFLSANSLSPTPLILDLTYLKAVIQGTWNQLARIPGTEFAFEYGQIVLRKSAGTTNEQLEGVQNLLPFHDIGRQMLEAYAPHTLSKGSELPSSPTPLEDISISAPGSGLSFVDLISLMMNSPNVQIKILDNTPIVVINALALPDNFTLNIVEPKSLTPVETRKEMASSVSDLMTTKENEAKGTVIEIPSTNPNPERDMIEVARERYNKASAEWTASHRGEEPPANLGYDKLVVAKNKQSPNGIVEEFIVYEVRNGEINPNGTNLKDVNGYNEYLVDNLNASTLHPENTLIVINMDRGLNTTKAIENYVNWIEVYDGTGSVKPNSVIAEQLWRRDRNFRENENGHDVIIVTSEIGLTKENFWNDYFVKNLYDQLAEARFRDTMNALSKAPEKALDNVSDLGEQLNLTPEQTPGFNSFLDGLRREASSFKLVFDSSVSRDPLTGETLLAELYIRAKLTNDKLLDIANKLGNEFKLSSDQMKTVKARLGAVDEFISINTYFEMLGEMTTSFTPRVDNSPQNLLTAFAQNNSTAEGVNPLFKPVEKLNISSPLTTASQARSPLSQSTDPLAPLTRTGIALGETAASFIPRPTTPFSNQLTLLPLSWLRNLSLPATAPPQQGYAIDHQPALTFLLRNDFTNLSFANEAGITVVEIAKINDQFVVTYNTSSLTLANAFDALAYLPTPNEFSHVRLNNEKTPVSYGEFTNPDSLPERIAEQVAEIVENAFNMVESTRPEIAPITPKTPDDVASEFTTKVKYIKKAKPQDLKNLAKEMYDSLTGESLDLKTFANYQITQANTRGMLTPAQIDELNSFFQEIFSIPDSGNNNIKLYQTQTDLVNEFTRIINLKVTPDLREPEAEEELVPVISSLPLSPLPARTPTKPKRLPIMTSIIMTTLLMVVSITQLASSYLPSSINFAPTTTTSSQSISLTRQGVTGQGSLEFATSEVVYNLALLDTPRPITYEEVKGTDLGLERMTYYAKVLEDFYRLQSTDEGQAQIRALMPKTASGELYDARFFSDPVPTYPKLLDDYNERLVTTFEKYVFLNLRANPELFPESLLSSTPFVSAWEATKMSFGATDKSGKNLRQLVQCVPYDMMMIALNPVGHQADLPELPLGDARGVMTYFNDHSKPQKGKTFLEAWNDGVTPITGQYVIEGANNYQAWRVNSITDFKSGDQLYFVSVDAESQENHVGHLLIFEVNGEKVYMFSQANDPRDRYIEEDVTATKGLPEIKIYNETSFEKLLEQLEFRGIDHILVVRSSIAPSDPAPLPTSLAGTLIREPNFSLTETEKLPPQSSLNPLIQAGRKIGRAIYDFYASPGSEKGRLAIPLTPAPSKNIWNNPLLVTVGRKHTTSKAHVQVSGASRKMAREQFGFGHNEKGYYLVNLSIEVPIRLSSSGQVLNYNDLEYLRSEEILTIGDGADVFKVRIFPDGLYLIYEKENIVYRFDANTGQVTEFEGSQAQIQNYVPIWPQEVKISDKVSLGRDPLIGYYLIEYTSPPSSAVLSGGQLAPNVRAQIKTGDDFRTSQDSYIVVSTTAGLTFLEKSSGKLLHLDEDTGNATNLTNGLTKYLQTVPFKASSIYSITPTETGGYLIKIVVPYGDTRPTSYLIDKDGNPVPENIAPEIKVRTTQDIESNPLGIGFNRPINLAIFNPNSQVEQVINAKDWEEFLGLFTLFQEKNPPQNPVTVTYTDNQGHKLRVDIYKKWSRTFGRSQKSSDIPISGTSTMGRTQFVINRKSNGELFISHVNSATNPTLLNGNNVLEPTLIKNGDIITVAGESFVVTIQNGLLMLQENIPNGTRYVLDGNGELSPSSKAPGLGIVSNLDLINWASDLGESLWNTLKTMFNSFIKLYEKERGSVSIKLFDKPTSIPNISERKLMIPIFTQSLLAATKTTQVEAAINTVITNFGSTLNIPRTSLNKYLAIIYQTNSLYDEDIIELLKAKIKNAEDVNTLTTALTTELSRYETIQDIAAYPDFDATIRAYLRANPSVSPNTLYFAFNAYSRSHAVPFDQIQLLNTEGTIENPLYKIQVGESTLLIDTKGNPETDDAQITLTPSSPTEPHNSSPAEAPAKAGLFAGLAFPSFALGGGGTTIAQSLASWAYNLIQPVATSVVQSLAPILAPIAVTPELRNSISNLIIYSKTLLVAHKLALPSFSIPPWWPQNIPLLLPGMAQVMTQTSTVPMVSKVSSQFSESDPNIPKFPNDLNDIDDHMVFLSYITGRVPNIYLSNISSTTIKLINKIVSSSEATALSVLSYLGKSFGIMGPSGEHVIEKEYVEPKLILESQNVAEITLRAQIAYFAKLFEQITENEYILNSSDYNLLPSNAANRFVRFYYLSQNLTLNNKPVWKYFDVPLSQLIEYSQNNPTMISYLAGTLLNNTTPPSIFESTTIETTNLVEPQESPIGTISFAFTDNSDNLPIDHPTLKFNPHIESRLVANFGNYQNDSSQNAPVYLKTLRAYSSHIVHGKETRVALDAADTLLSQANITKDVSPISSRVTVKVTKALKGSYDELLKNSLKLPTIFINSKILGGRTGITKVVSRITLDSNLIPLLKKAGAHGDFKPILAHTLAAAQTFGDPENNINVAFVIAPNNTPNIMGIAVTGGFAYNHLSRLIHGLTDQYDFRQSLDYANQMIKLQAKDPENPNYPTISRILTSISNLKDLVQSASRILVGQISEATIAGVQISALGNGDSATFFETAVADDIGMPHGIGSIGNNITHKDVGDPYLWVEAGLEVFHNPELAAGSPLKNAYQQYIRNIKSPSTSANAIITNILTLPPQEAIRAYHRLVATSFTDANLQLSFNEATTYLLSVLSTLTKNEVNAEKLRDTYITNSQLITLRYTENLYKTTLYLAHKLLVENQQTGTSDETLEQIQAVESALTTIHIQMEELKPGSTTAPTQLDTEPISVVSTQNVLKSMIAGNPLYNQNSDISSLGPDTLPDMSYAPISDPSTVTLDDKGLPTFTPNPLILKSFTPIMVDQNLSIAALQQIIKTNPIYGQASINPKNKTTNINTLIRNMIFGFWPTKNADGNYSTFPNLKQFENNQAGFRNTGYAVLVNPNVKQPLTLVGDYATIVRPEHLIFIVPNETIRNQILKAIESDPRIDQTKSTLTTIKARIFTLEEVKDGTLDHLPK